MTSRGCVKFEGVCMTASECVSAHTGPPSPVVTSLCKSLYRTSLPPLAPYFFTRISTSESTSAGKHRRISRSNWGFVTAPELGRSKSRKKALTTMPRVRTSSEQEARMADAAASSSSVNAPWGMPGTYKHTRIRAGTHSGT